VRHFREPGSLPPVPGSRANDDDDQETFLHHEKTTKLITAASAALLGLFCGCKPETALLPPPKPEPRRLRLKTVHPIRGAITRRITLPGEIKAYQQATLYAKVAGYLKTIRVDQGRQVKEGELLAEIEVPELEADGARYQAEVKVAESDYKRLSESQKKAPDLVIPQTVDDAEGKRDVAKANLQRTETLLRYAKIIAPFAGIISKRMVDPGAFIPAATSGSAAQNAAIVTLTDFNRVRVQVAVPELESSLISTGQPVKLTVDGLPGRGFDGNITRFSYTLDEASKTMLAEIELPNPKLELRPGMYAVVKIGIERRKTRFWRRSMPWSRREPVRLFSRSMDNKRRKTRVQKPVFNDGTNDRNCQRPESRPAGDTRG